MGCRCGNHDYTRAVGHKVCQQNQLFTSYALILFPDQVHCIAVVITNSPSDDYLGLTVHVNCLPLLSLGEFSMEKKRQMQNCALLSSKQSKMNGLQTERTPKRVTGPARKQDKNSFKEAWVQVTAGLQDYSLLN